MSQETNILFDPPLLTKKRLSFLSYRGELPEAAQNLFLTDLFTATCDRLGNLRILDSSYRADTSAGQRITSSSALAASEELLVFGDANGLTLRDFVRQGNPLSFKPGLGQDPGGFHIAGQWLFEVHYLDEENLDQQSIVIAKTPLSSTDNSGWQLVEKYRTTSKNFSFLQKGEKSLLLFRDEYGRSNMIVFDRKGPDRPLLIQTRIGLATNERGQPLISPGEKRGSYFTLSHLNVEGDLELGFTEPVNGLVNEEPLLELGSERVKDIVTRGQRGLLLTDKELFLFNESGIETSWPLGEIAGEYNRLLWSGLLWGEKHALLWQEGGRQVQEINLDAF